MKQYIKVLELKSPPKPEYQNGKLRVEITTHYLMYIDTPNKITQKQPLTRYQFGSIKKQSNNVKRISFDISSGIKIHQIMNRSCN